MRHVPIYDGDAVLLAGHHLAQHHRLLHRWSDREERPLLAQTSQDAPRLALNPRIGLKNRLGGRDGHGRRLLEGGSGSAIGAVDASQPLKRFIDQRIVA